MVRLHHHSLINLSFSSLLFFFLLSSFLSSFTLAVEIRTDDILAKGERIHFWGEKDSAKISKEKVELSSVSEVVVSLDTLINNEKITLPKGVDSIKVVLSPSSKQDTFFPSHIPSSHLYVQYFANYTKQTVNHTQLTNFVNNFYGATIFSNSLNTTTRLAPVREDITPIYKNYLPSDPFIAREEIKNVGYLRFSPPSSQLISEQSLFSQQKQNTQKFLSLFFPWYTSSSLSNLKEITTNEITLEVSRCSEKEQVQAFGKSFSNKVLRVSFTESVKVSGSPKLSIPAPLEQLNYKFALYYFFESEYKQSTSLSIFEVDANGNFVEREKNINVRGNTSWKVSMHRSIEKEGYHRDLVTDLTIDGTSTSKNSEECHVIILEYFTNDVYVDFDQMSEFERFGGPPFVLFEYVDVEVTAFNPVASHFLLSIKKSFISSEKQVKLNITIPIHMRYQTPQYNALSLPVYISPPEVYIQCANLQTPSQSGTEDSGLPFKETTTTIDGVSLTHVGNPVLTVLVPTGKLEDVGLVSWVTALATFGATAFILFEIFWKSGPSIKKD